RCRENANQEETMTSIPLEAGKINPADPPKELTLLGGAPARWGNNKPFQTVQETWRRFGWEPKPSDTR
ncbi:MAG: hypothetical protein M0Z78_06205, partial [Betaproteobacteria bacterium]|nr:hypothetical protein [Betaproteobacteria bacterium]